MATTKVPQNIWWLGSAGRYRDRVGQGCFSPPDLVSLHSFGWDRDAQGFVMNEQFGLGGSLSERLVMPTELAEAFLLRCLEPAFRERFFAFYPKENLNEAVKAGGRTLTLHRSRANFQCGGGITGFSLSLDMKAVGSRGEFFLFPELYRSFGVTTSKLCAEDIQAKLRAA